MGELLTTLLAIGALSLVPLLFIASTSFVKLSFVFSVLRNALGTGQVPSGIVISALAAILSFYVMAPVFAEMAERGAVPAARIDPDALLGAQSVQALAETWTASKAPLQAFLQRNAGERERELFARLARKGGGAGIDAADLRVVLPAFLITELKEAFQIAFFVLLPFLVIDLVVSGILLSLGMFMLSPAVVSLPFKLLLFVLVDGFYVLSEALIAGYA